MRISALLFLILGWSVWAQTTDTAVNAPPAAAAPAMTPQADAVAAASTEATQSTATQTTQAPAQPVMPAVPGLSFNEIESRVMSESQADKLTRENLNRLMEIRDPFERPALAEVGQQVILADLEQFSLDQLKLRGIITGPKKMRALVLTPAGKVHIVAENSKIGDRGGVITKITPYSIVVKEKFKDELLNTLETRTRELVLDKAPAASGG